MAIRFRGKTRQWQKDSFEYDAGNRLAQEAETYTMALSE